MMLHGFSGPSGTGAKKWRLNSADTPGLRQTPTWKLCHKSLLARRHKAKYPVKYDVGFCQPLTHLLRQMLMFYCCLKTVNMWHLNRLSSFIFVLLHIPCGHVHLHTCVPACPPECPLLNVSLSLYFPCFSKTYSPQRKGHTHSLSVQPATAKCMNSLTWPHVLHQSPFSNVPSAVNNTHHHPWWHMCWMQDSWPEKIVDCFLLARYQWSWNLEVSQPQGTTSFFPPHHLCLRVRTFAKELIALWRWRCFKLAGIMRPLQTGDLWL